MKFIKGAQNWRSILGTLPHPTGKGHGRHFVASPYVAVQPSSPVCE